jgi:26S proteasome regulatory subunit (ATPase 3-interacting protein)
MLIVLDQDEGDEASPSTLKEMEDEATRLRNATTALKAEEKELRLALREGASQVPLPELKASVSVLREQKTEMTAWLAKLKGWNLKPVSLEEREKVGAEFRKWQRVAGARKKIRVELWKEIEGNIEREKIAETKEELGLEF